MKAESLYDGSHGTVSRTAGVGLRGGSCTAKCGCCCLNKVVRGSLGVGREGGVETIVVVKVG